MMPAAWTWIPAIAVGAVALWSVGVGAADPNAGASRKPTPERPAPLFMVRQQLEGEVTKLDPANGIVVVKTPGGKLTIALPQRPLASLRKADRVLLELGILPSAPHASSGSGRHIRHGRDLAIVRQRVEAQVRGVDLGTGVLTLQPPGGRVKLELPSKILEVISKPV